MSFASGFASVLVPVISSSLLGGGGGKSSKQRQQESEKDIYDALEAAQTHKAFVTRAGEQRKMYGNVFQPYGDNIKPSKAQNFSTNLAASLERRFPRATEHVAQKVAATRTRFKDPDPIGRTSMEGAERKLKTRYASEVSMWS